MSFYSIFCAFDNATKLLSLPIYEGIVHVAFIKSIFSDKNDPFRDIAPIVCSITEI